MEPYKYLHFVHEKLSGIATITLDWIEKMNAFNSDMQDELYDALEKVHKDNTIKGLIITGNGKLFCAGAYIPEVLELDTSKGFNFAQKGQKLFRFLETLDKPSIAAINGGAYGAGCELALSATLRIAATDVRFGLPEVKLGVIPGFGGTQRLARLVGKGRALELCITGRTITAEEALQWGLISEIAEPCHLLSRANALMSQILAMAPLAVKSVMTVIDTGYDLTLEDALQMEALHFALLCNSKDKAIGTNAFINKVPAEFLGE